MLERLPYDDRGVFPKTEAVPFETGIDPKRYEDEKLVRCMPDNLEISEVYILRKKISQDPETDAADWRVIILSHDVKREEHRILLCFEDDANGKEHVIKWGVFFTLDGLMYTPNFMTGAEDEADTGYLLSAVDGTENPNIDIDEKEPLLVA